MIHDVTAIEHLDEYRLRLTFDDGAQGDVDIAGLVRFDGVFEPLRDLTEFRKVRVDAESGTIAWPNGADLDPLVLYSKATGVELEELLASQPKALP